MAEPISDEERIIAAAVKIGDVALSMPPPARHWTIINTLCGTLDKPDATRYAQPDDQGFLTDQGRFVSRVEALGIAWAAGQLKKAPTMRELYTEDLW
ncbi:hypothetical protein [Hyphomicrobium sp. ghe19]|uniref:hypothetical protein n=1 Tax=Hyphomicrobium sp. ghe19 TaxID=2682968 RepID=UPI001367162F|nr:hypothetical protein HYPP_01479 [Hyphomicrobium sp. ghe19]